MNSVNNIPEVKSLDWLTFKSALGRQASVTYIDEEESEIAIDSECEFQEALRLARLNNNRLRIIVSDKLHPSQKVYLKVDLPVANPMKKSVSTGETAMTPIKKTSHHSSKDGPPEWFTNYMMKFKKELFHELKMYIHGSIHSAVKNERKLITTKLDDVIAKRSESLPSVSSQTKKSKKKSSIKRELKNDSVDAIKQREVKLQKKLEKLHTAKSERREKLDNKRALLEETVKLATPNLDKIFLEKFEKRKSVCFREKNVFLLLSPGSKFVLNVDLVNDGQLSWSKPRLECFFSGGLTPKERSISLPKLNPNESFSVTLGGKASNALGLHHLKWRVVDGLEPFEQEFTCWARVELFHSAEKSHSGAKGTAGALVSSEKEVIESSQKKIDNNITEIQRMLHNIDIFRESIGGELETNVKEKSKTGCDLLQGLKVKEKEEERRKERLEQEKVMVGIDCLRFAPSVSEEKADEKPDKSEEINDCSGSDCSSHSKISIIYMSEEDEDENFIFVSPRSPSPAESVDEDKNFPERENTTARTNEQTEGKNSDVQMEKEPHPKEVSVAEISHTIPTRSLSPFGEDTFKTKKIKSKSTEYQFTTENLTQPTFIQVPEGDPQGRPFTFKFTAGKEGKSDTVEDFESKNTPKIDAVNSENIHKAQATHSEGMKKSGESSQTRSPPADRFNEIPFVTLMPNVLMSSASNMAAMGFNTGKFLLNSLQAAFASQRRAEPGHPGYPATNRALAKTLLTLVEMGFTDCALLEALLEFHSNDLNKVIDSLLEMQQQERT